MNTDSRSNISMTRATAGATGTASECFKPPRAMVSSSFSGQNVKNRAFNKGDYNQIRDEFAHNRHLVYEPSKTHEGLHFLSKLPFQARPLSSYNIRKTRPETTNVAFQRPLSGFGTFRTNEPEASPFVGYFAGQQDPSTNLNPDNLIQHI